SVAALGALPFDWPSHFIGEFQLTPAESSDAALEVSANELSISGSTLTSLALERELWVATYSGSLRVERGTLDRLRLQIPSIWAGPFELDANVAASMAMVVDDSERPVLSI